MGGINAKEKERKGQTNPQGAEIDQTGPQYRAQEATRGHRTKQEEREDTRQYKPLDKDKGTPEGQQERPDGGGKVHGSFCGEKSLRGGLSPRKR